MEQKSAFLEIMGNGPVLRVLDFLVVNEDFDYSMTDIAELSGVGYSTLKQFWGVLEQKGIIRQTRVVGKARMFRLNPESPVVLRFREFYWEITRQSVRSDIKKSALRVEVEGDNKK